MSRLLFPVVLLSIAAAAVAAQAEDGWSKPSNGLQARLRFTKTDGFNGTPYVVTYLELRNVSHVANVLDVPLQIGSITFELKDETGRAIQPSNGPFDGTSVDLGMLRLPYDSHLRFNIASRGAGVPRNQAGLLDLGPSSNWIFPAGDKHSYFLSAKFTISRSTSRVWAGTIEIPATQLPRIAK